MDDLTIQKHLENIQKDFVNTAKSFLIYVEVLNLSGFMGMDPEGYKYVHDGMDHIISIFGKPISITQGVDIAFNIYFNVYKCLEIVYKSFDIFATNKVKSSEVGIHRSESVITTSLVQESDVKFNISENTRNQLIDTIADAKLSYNITEFILQNTEAEASKLTEIANIINTEYHKYATENTSIYVYPLYVCLLDTLFDMALNIKNSAQVTKHLTKMLEITKSKLLVPYLGARQAHNRSANTIQKLVQTYRLIPATDCMPLKDLLRVFAKVEVQDAEPNIMLANAAKIMSSSHINYGFVLMYKVLKSPVLHNIDVLINDEYIAARNLHQASTIGVNQITLDRTCTILPIPAKPTPDSITVFNEHHKPDGINRYYIIESVDGIGYRITHPWGFGSKIYDVPADMYDFLDSPALTPSRRIESYNNITEVEIIGNIQERLSTKDLSQLYELKMEDSYWGGVRGKIRNLNIDKYIDKIKSYRLISEHDIYKLMSDNNINQRVVHTVAVLAQDDLSQKLNIPTQSLKQQFKYELALTYCANMLQFRNNFAIKMREAYSEKYSKKIREIIGSQKVENTPAITHAATDVVKQVFDDALLSFINRFNGVFVAMKNKMDILEKTLLV